MIMVTITTAFNSTDPSQRLSFTIYHSETLVLLWPRLWLRQASCSSRPWLRNSAQLATNKYGEQVENKAIVEMGYAQCNGHVYTVYLYAWVCPMPSSTNALKAVGPLLASLTLRNEGPEKVSSPFRQLRRC